jgi:hypothetical protein
MGLREIARNSVNLIFITRIQMIMTMMYVTQNYWGPGLGPVIEASSKGPNRVGFSLPSPENRNRSMKNAVFWDVTPCGS